MKRYIHSNEDIFAMSNVRGNKVKVDTIPFSFYYSVKKGEHGPRVKVTMNTSNLRPNRMSSMKLCDDWGIDRNPDDGFISSKDEMLMKKFFRKYLVMFLLVWEDMVQEPALADYMEGDISFNEFVESLDFYDSYADELDKIKSIDQLEKFCRDNDIVNFYGN